MFHTQTHYNVDIMLVALKSKASKDVSSQY